MIDYMEAKVSTRARVTIPIALRRKFGIKPGMRLIVREEEGRIVVMTFTQYVHSLRGALKSIRGGGRCRQTAEMKHTERMSVLL